jgi:hypothetical protein
MQVIVTLDLPRPARAARLIVSFPFDRDLSLALDGVIIALEAERRPAEREKLRSVKAYLEQSVPLCSRKEVA